MNNDSIKLLDADTLARADKLGMAARFIVEGYMAGEHLATQGFERIGMIQPPVKTRTSVAAFRYSS